MASTSNTELLKTAWNGPGAAEKYLRGETATRPYAALLVEKSGLPSLPEGQQATVFDLACGTGSLEAELYKAMPREKWNQLKILGGDLSEAMLSFLKERGEKEGWSGLEVGVVDGGNISLPPSTYTHLFINFGIFAMPPTTLPSCSKLIKPGGFIGVTSWAYMPWYGHLAKAVKRLNERTGKDVYCPTNAEVDEKVYEDRGWKSEAYMQQVLSENGFERVQVWSVPARPEVGNVRQFLESMNMPIRLLSSFWDESQREELVKEVGDCLFELLMEENGGDEEKAVALDFEAVLGVGWKTKAQGVQDG